MRAPGAASNAAPPLGEGGRPRGPATSPVLEPIASAADARPPGPTSRMRQLLPPLSVRRSVPALSSAYPVPAVTNETSRIACEVETAPALQVAPPSVVLAKSPTAPA